MAQLAVSPTVQTDAILEPREERVTTLLDLVAAVAEVSTSEAEIVATVVHLINSGRIRLVGCFQGADVRVG